MITLLLLLLLLFSHTSILLLADVVTGNNDGIVCDNNDINNRCSNTLSVSSLASHLLPMITVIVTYPINGSIVFSDKVHVLFDLEYVVPASVPIVSLQTQEYDLCFIFDKEYHPITNTVFDQCIPLSSCYPRTSATIDIVMVDLIYGHKHFTMAVVKHDEHSASKSLGTAAAAVKTLSYTTTHFFVQSSSGGLDVLAVKANESKALNRSVFFDEVYKQRIWQRGHTNQLHQAPSRSAIHWW